MMRPPPRPPLFPYTTLFRSLAQQIAALATGAGFEAPEVAGPGFINFRLKAGNRLSIIHRVLKEKAQFGRSDAGRGEPVQVDRKSTRLNSSHQIISYAVFCLK